MTDTTLFVTQHPEATLLVIVGLALVVLLLVFRLIRLNRNTVELELQRAEVAGLQERELQLQADIARLQDLLRNKDQRQVELEKALSAEQVRLQEQKTAWQKEVSFVQESREQLAKEFELLANRVLESKKQSYDKLAEQSWQRLVGPFHEQLQSFNQRLKETHQVDSAQRNQLLGQITALQKQSQQVSEETLNLTNALKGNNKALGSWGEVILENLLEASGLVKGREYEVQSSFAAEQGGRAQPDVVIHLPEGRSVVVDSKVSLLAYEKFVNAEHKDDQQRAQKQLTDSVRAHIKNLAAKNYSDLDALNSLDFVIMFIPLEAAFVTVAQAAPEALTEAFSRRVVLVSPSSLMVVLKTIETLWSRQKQDENVSKIVTEAGKLYDQFVLVMESLQEVGTGLQRTSENFDKVVKRLGTGRGNLVKRIEDLRKLGAKAGKVLPGSVIERAQADQGSDDELTSGSSGADE